VATFLLFVGLLFLTAIVFTIWLVMRVIGAIFGMVFGGGSCDAKKRPHMNSPTSPGMSACSQPGCRALNPVHARFCRRCGNPVGAHAPRMRYVA
jgi:hypothetical protein